MNNSGYCMVNLHHVTEVRATEAVVGKEAIPISRRKKNDFLKRLAEFM